MELIKPEIIRRPRMPKSTSSIWLIDSIRQRNEQPITSAAMKRKFKSGSRCELCTVKVDRKAYSTCISCNRFVCGEHKIAFYKSTNCNKKQEVKSVELDYEYLFPILLLLIKLGSKFHSALTSAFIV